MSRKKLKIETNDKAFSGRLRIAMGDMSVYKLAQTTGISRSLIQKYLHDLSAPSIEMADRLADGLEISFLWLSKGDGPMKEGKKSLDILLAPENLRKMNVDLYTVVQAAEKTVKKAKKEEDISPKNIARDIALSCMGMSEK